MILPNEKVLSYSAIMRNGRTRERERMCSVKGGSDFSEREERRGSGDFSFCARMDLNQRR